MPENSHHTHGEGHGDMSGATASQRLTNEDFRKLMMTPRVGGFGSMPPPSTTTPGLGSIRATSSIKKSSSGKLDHKKSKKNNAYVKEKREDEEILAELAKKYRDRAKERREGGEPMGPDALTTLGAYRAVAPDIKSTMDAAERRKQMIQESKFLGGDMEHTHLVKGLDYALLQKVRSEIEQQELEEEARMEEAIEEGEKIAKEKEKKKESEEEIQFKTIMGKNIFRAVFKSKPQERNEHFLPGRMAYLIELEDEMAETDIPTTVLRSKADCPGLESQATLSTNDIVINKLTQILSYLRQGGKQAKKAKRAKDKEMVAPQTVPGMKINRPVNDSIYGDIGSYNPAVNKDKNASRDRRGERRDYFDDKSRKDKDFDKDSDKSKEKSATILEAERTLGALLKPGADQYKKRESGSKKADNILSKLSAQPEGYAECYPGFEEMNDALEDSDDEVDYSKMDLGNKKGPVGRWDFDTAEEYSEYMNKKEALPKAAFQYGVKMADGRKTRRIGAKTEKSERAELDREWQKIQAIIHKRKSSGPAFDSPNPEKVARR